MVFINRKIEGIEVDKEFEKQIRNKRKRKLSLVIIMTLILITTLVSFRMGNGKGTKEGEVRLEIRCDELVQHPEKMKKPELWKDIPKDGIILKETKCTMKSGETVFDILNRVCKEKNIQIEYSHVVGYDSYYVEGIQYLYEFDAGKRSGWMYLIDGENTNYGCSQYKLKGGEKIVWKYVCDYK